MRYELDGGWHFGRLALGFLDPLQAPRAEVFLLGHGADRVDVLLTITSYKLAVAPHTSLQVDKGVRVADGAKALGVLLALPREALPRLARDFHLLRGLRETRGDLGRAAETSLPRVHAVILRVLLHIGELLFRHHHGLGGSTLLAAIGAATALLSSCCTWKRSGE